MSDWMTRAACKGQTSIFFSTHWMKTRDAKFVCAGCYVIDKCRVYALDHPELQGVWGGLDERERAALRRGDHLVAAPE